MVTVSQGRQAILAQAAKLAPEPAEVVRACRPVSSRIFTGELRVLSTNVLHSAPYSHIALVLCPPIILGFVCCPFLLDIVHDYVLPHVSCIMFAA